MAITSVQSNIETPKATYRDAKTPIKTNNLVHPLPAEGHLVHDSLLSIPKFWMKDFAYDIKAVKDGLNGTAKDHQTGRLNDVGLKLGGIGIATYLASRTSDPKARIMEYLGLGAFLAAMSLYPKIAINAPSRIIQGFDIGKEYIDDQGRKKSVYQDGNYIPFDMYRGEFVGEDLDILGDRMGIPRDIKNRNELIKEQARKIAIQNNTLWMLGAGLATPVITALICYGTERILSPILEASRNKLYNSKIAHMLKETDNEHMTLNIKNINQNSLSKKVFNMLEKYTEKELPQEELDKLINILACETDENLRDGIKEDLNRLFKSGKDSFYLGENAFDDISKIIKESATGRNNATFNEIFTPSKSEIEQALKNSGSDGKYINADQLNKFKSELKKIFSAKIEACSYNKNALYMQENNVIDNISKSIQNKPSLFVSKNSIIDVKNLAKILGDFKAKDEILDKCKSFKVEHAPETILARSYKKFEETLFGALDIQFKDLKLMKESEKYTKEILDKKIQILVNNELKYEKTIEKLAKIMSEMEIRLHGYYKDNSILKDLITAYENNYNNTAKRINQIGHGKFSKIIDKLVKEDINTLTNSIESREDVFKLIDGLITPELLNKEKPEAEARLELATHYAKGVGSSKQLKISRIVDRIQGVENSQRRIIHLLDVYKRKIPEDEYGKHLNKIVKDILMDATSADHTLKLHTDNNPLYYLNIMEHGWATPAEESTKKALRTVNNIKQGAILDRYNNYLKRFLDVIGNNDIDFTKPDHKLVDNLKEHFRNFYSPDSITRMQKFNLIAQNPVDFFKKASKTRFENHKWLRVASIIGGSVVTATVLMQFNFGKIRNPHNIQKQVNNDKNK